MELLLNVKAEIKKLDEENRIAIDKVNNILKELKI
jgi:hypothetical protein